MEGSAGLIPPLPPNTCCTQCTGRRQLLPCSNPCTAPASAAPLGWIWPLCIQGEPRTSRGVSPQTCGLGCGIPPLSSACQQCSRPSFFGKDSNNSLFRLNTTSPGKEQEPVPQPSFGWRGCLQRSSPCSKCPQRAFRDSPSPALAVPGSSCPTAEAPLVPPQLITCPACLPRSTPHPASTKVLLCWQESAFLVTPRELSLMNASWEIYPPP